MVARVRPDAIIATGRSDYPNQVNNVLCFPYIFRGALDCGATEINAAMELACVEAIAELARIEPDEVVARAYGGAQLLFGPEHIIPKPFDPRLALLIAPAVARAAMATGRRAPPDRSISPPTSSACQRFAYRSGQLMHPVFEQARSTLQARRLCRRRGRARAARGAGGDRRAARASGADRAARAWCRRGSPRSACAWCRIDGISRSSIRSPTRRSMPPLDGALCRAGRSARRDAGAARKRVRRRPAIAAAHAARTRGWSMRRCAAAPPTGGSRPADILPIIPRLPGLKRVYALSALIVGEQTLFFCDTHMNVDPTAEEVAEMTLLAADAVRRFGIVPQGGAAQPQQFRRVQFALGQEDAARAASGALRCARTRDRRRDARRRRVGAGAARTDGRRRAGSRARPICW